MPLSRAPLCFVVTALEVRKTAGMTDAPPAPRTARERARAEIMAEIVATAMEHLARDGAAALSLRAVARDLGMVSSAVYRYVPTRDALLTLLIIDAYDSLGAAAEKAEARIDRADHLGRFLATCHAVRNWALANPHEYALIYGSPVPGYAAPQDTVGPASRVPRVLIAILLEERDAGTLPDHGDVAPPVSASLVPVRDFVDGLLPDAILLRSLGAFAALYGAVSFELFGQWHNVVTETAKARTAFFDAQMRLLAAGLLA